MLAAFSVSALGTRLLIGALANAEVLDTPNARSNHAVPVPRGGGIAVIATILFGWVAAAWLEYFTGAELLLFYAMLALLLAAVSWLDDRKGLPQWPRLLVQMLSVMAVLVFFPGELFQGWLPGWLDKLAMGLLWLWFINLYNFMDGIDGITGAETCCLGLGVAGIAMMTELADGIGLFALIISGASLGFLIFNWHPAKIFPGDVGSIPLGFLLGLLLLIVAAYGGYWAAALIFPAYYVADATVTLMRRMLRGEKFWQAHSEHAYQLAVRSGASHSAVVLKILRVNGLLLMLGWLSLVSTEVAIACVAVAYFLVFGFLKFLSRLA